MNLIRILKLSSFYLASVSTLLAQQTITLNNGDIRSAAVNTTAPNDPTTFTISSGSAVPVRARSREQVQLLRKAPAQSCLTASNPFSGGLNINNGNFTLFDSADLSSVGTINIAPDPADNGLLYMNGGSGSPSITTNQRVHVGLYGIGELSIESGDFTNIGLSSNDGGMLVGSNAGSTGTVRINGSNSSLDLNGFFTLGESGDGFLLMDNSGSFQALESSFGLNAGATGTGTISNHSDFSLTNDLVLGNLGTGTLTVESGSSVNLLDIEADAILGDGSSGQGTLHVTGSGTSVTIGDGIYVGSAGTGTMTIDSGAKVTGAFSDIGSGSSSIGSVTVDGNGSVFELTTWELYIGYKGAGTLTLSNVWNVSPSPKEWLPVRMAVDGSPQGILNIGKNPLDSNPTQGPGIMDVEEIRGGSTSSIINFYHNSDSYYFTRNGKATGEPIEFSLTGYIQVNFYEGFTSLEHTTDTIIGPTKIYGGILSPSKRPMSIGFWTLDWYGGNIQMQLGADDANSDVIETLSFFSPPPQLLQQAC